MDRPTTHHFLCTTATVGSALTVVEQVRQYTPVPMATRSKGSFAIPSAKKAIQASWEPATAHALKDGPMRYFLAKSQRLTKEIHA